MKTLLIPAALAVVTVFAAGCAEGGDAGAAESDVVVGVWTDSVTVAPEGLTFKKHIAETQAFKDTVAKVRAYQAAPDPSAAEPVYLVGGRQRDALNADGTVRSDVGNPNGYLRRGVSVKENPDGTVFIGTEQASVAEANEELQRVGLLSITRRGGDPAAWQWGRTIPFDVLDYAEERTLMEQNLLGGATAKLALETRLKIGGELDLAVSGSKYLPSEAKAIMEAKLDGSAVLHGTFEGATQLRNSPLTLFSAKKNIPNPSALPLTMGVDVTAQCLLAANGSVDAKAGIEVHGGLVAGASRDQASGTRIHFTPSWPAFTPVGPTLSSSAVVEGDCTVTATLKLQIFDAAGPEATAKVWLKVLAQGTSEQLSGDADVKVTSGVEASAAGVLSPFGFKVAEIRTEPWKKEWQIFPAQ